MQFLSPQSVYLYSYPVTSYSVNGLQRAKERKKERVVAGAKSGGKREEKSIIDDEIV
jgi:hypothetical protein